VPKGAVPSGTGAALLHQRVSPWTVAIRATSRG
jgi:hypothetical protein